MQTATDETTTDERVAQLRGAGVAPVNTRRLGRMLVWVCVAGLGVASAVLFAAAAHRNAQLDDLERNGVAVNVTVTACDGLLGGSGTNVSSYVCRGSFTLDGRHYEDRIPTTAFYPPKTAVPAVVARDDPGLLYTDAQAASEHPSDGPYVLPLVLGLLAVGLAAGAAVAFTRRRGPTGA